MKRILRTDAHAAILPRPQPLNEQPLNECSQTNLPAAKIASKTTVERSVSSKKNPRTIQNVQILHNPHNPQNPQKRKIPKNQTYTRIEIRRTKRIELVKLVPPNTNTGDP